MLRLSLQPYKLCNTYCLSAAYTKNTSKEMVSRKYCKLKMFRKIFTSYHQTAFAQRNKGEGAIWIVSAA